MSLLEKKNWHIWNSSEDGETSAGASLGQHRDVCHRHHVVTSSYRQQEAALRKHVPGCNAQKNPDCREVLSGLKIPCPRVQTQHQHLPACLGANGLLLHHPALGTNSALSEAQPARLGSLAGCGHANAPARGKRAVPNPHGTKAARPLASSLSTSLGGRGEGLRGAKGAREAALTIPSAGSPGSHCVMENPVHPHQEPAYTKAQQKSQHQVDLLLGYIVSHKVILRGVHHRLIPVIRNDVVDMMPVAGNRKREKHQRSRAECHFHPAPALGTRDWFNTVPLSFHQHFREQKRCLGFLCLCQQRNWQRAR